MTRIQIHIKNNGVLIFKLSPNKILDVTVRHTPETYLVKNFNTKVSREDLVRSENIELSIY